MLHVIFPYMLHVFMDFVGAYPEALMGQVKAATWIVNQFAKAPKKNQSKL